MAAARKKAPEAVLFGRKLRQIRAERGWSQEQLAASAGVSLNYIGNLERGEQGPSLNIILRLARAFEIDGARLLEVFRAETVKKLRLS